MHFQSFQFTVGLSGDHPIINQGVSILRLKFPQTFMVWIQATKPCEYWLVSPNGPLWSKHLTFQSPSTTFISHSAPRSPLIFCNDSSFDRYTLPYLPSGSFFLHIISSKMPFLTTLSHPRLFSLLQYSYLVNLFIIVSITLFFSYLYSSIDNRNHVLYFTFESIPRS